MAIETAKLEAVFTADTKDFDKGVKRVSKGMGDLSKDLGSGLKSIGKGISGIGSDILGMTAPLAAGFGLAIHSAMQFDSTMANIGAVLGKTKGEMGDLRAEIMAIGAENTFGIQGTAEAFQEIAGGVQDASTHMAILNMAIATAEAGQAGLQATTAGLVSTMNSYKFSAEQATYASDVMTQTVGMGVGTMDELAAAMPQVTGLAASLGISFEEIGGSMAYLSTQGFSFSQAGTQLRAMMTALLNPNEKMKAALAELGYETGAALIETEGLVGAYQQLASTGMAEKEFAAMLGSTEALTGATALLSTEAGGATKFMNDFGESLTGATERARATNLDTASAQFNLLKSQVGALVITVGEALLPILNDLLVTVTPVIESFAQWATENPGTVQTIAVLTFGLTALGAVLVPLGAIVGSVGTVVGLLGGALGVIATVASGVVGALGAIVVAAAPIAGPFIAAAAAVGGLIAALNELRYTGTDVGAYYKNTTAEQRAGDANALMQAGNRNVQNRNGANAPMTGQINPVFMNTGITPPNRGGGITRNSGRAQGGNIPSGWSGWVGEDGPEWISNNRGAKTVFSNPMTPGGNNYGGRMVGAGAGGGNVTINNLTVNGVQNAQQLFDQLRKIANQRGG